MYHVGGLTAPADNLSLGSSTIGGLIFDNSANLCRCVLQQPDKKVALPTIEIRGTIKMEQTKDTNMRYLYEVTFVHRQTLNVFTVKKIARDEVTAVIMAAIELQLPHDDLDDYARDVTEIMEVPLLVD